MELMAMQHQYDAAAMYTLIPPNSPKLLSMRPTANALEEMARLGIYPIVRPLNSIFPLTPGHRCRTLFELPPRAVLVNLISFFS